ncbi:MULTISPECIES: DUF4625 domain-containing protein [unclassified Saccharicrinis]|uniref:DUF4625 domain-containing protein n=1 Tax=unclassified Saccharicrinis TaxID=2646859 RepID=UPI003D34EFBF
MKKILFVLPIFIFVFVACSSSDEVDTTKPTIELMKPVDGEAFHPGDKIEFICNFSDNDELASYKVDIHSAFDSHAHSAIQLKSGAEEDHGEAWDYENTWTFEDGLSTASVSHQEMVIPVTILHEGVSEEVAEGHYHLGVYCLDAAGNQSEFFIEIEIEHEE